MTTIVFCNVGNRDVNGLNPDDKKPREHGRLLLERLENGDELSPLQFPIIQPCLNLILALSGRVDQLILFATDQEDEKYNHSDTIHYADLLETLLPGRFPDRIGEIKIELIHGINPSYYDDAFKFYSRKLAHYTTSDITRCYVMVAGGIPACNMALMLHGLNLFDESCQVIYQTQEQEPMRLSIGQAIIRPVLAAQHLKKFDFAAAHELLSGQLVPGSLARSLLEYARARLWFDFSAAREALEYAITAAHNRSDRKPKLLEERKTLERLAGGDAKALIAELYYNARIAWENGRYVDFLGRAIRFQRAVIIYLAHLYLPQNSAPPASKELAGQPHFRKLLLANLSSTLPQEKTNVPQEIRTRLLALMHETFTSEEINTELLFVFNIKTGDIPGPDLQSRCLQLIEYMERRGRLPLLVQTARSCRSHHPGWQNLPDLPNQTPAVIPVLQRLERLVPLRDRSIIAHGYDGVSRRILEKDYNEGESGPIPFDPVQDMALVCQALDIPTENPFRQVAAWITSEIGAEISAK